MRSDPFRARAVGVKKGPNGRGETAFGAMVTTSGSVPGKPGLFFASPEMRAMIEKVAVKVALPSGSSLFLKGDESDSFYSLDKGEIEISVTSADGEKLSLEILTPPEVFGEIGLLPDAGRRMPLP
jgi:CRP-like cAMP-binding protein